MFSLNLLINLLSAATAGVGYFIPEPYGAFVRAVGWFAFSGAVTNWLAIHMLFEKIPGFYGSGIIQLRFKEFQGSLERLIHREFLDNAQFQTQLRGFIEAARREALPVDAIKQSIDLDKVFTAFSSAVMESSFGGMLKMFGGAGALEPLKEPLQKKLGALLDETLRDAARHLPESQEIEAHLLAVVRHAVAERVASLKPIEVKNLLHELTDRYTPWLVIWGAVFGGALGALSVLVQP